MAQEPASGGSGSVVASGSATSGLNVNLHPLPILNISDHCTRTRHAAPGSKIIGALLGNQTNRDLSIINSFELTYSAKAQGGPSGTTGEDVNMDGLSAASGSVVKGKYILDAGFLETRREQFKQVFPTLDVVGWYSVGEEPTADDIGLHTQFASSIDSPIFLLFDPTSISSTTQELPFKVYESALAEGAAGASGDAGSKAKFMQLEYGVETGEAERIAVDGVTRGDMDGDGESAVVSNLTTQRNAIKMLSDRIAVVSQYIADVADNKIAEPDHALLRQISSLVAGLPTIDAIEFKQELHTEFQDVQLTQYLSDLTRQLNALDEYTDKHHHLYPERNEREPGFGAGPFVERGFGGRGVMAGGSGGGKNARTKGRH